MDSWRFGTVMVRCSLGIATPIYASVFASMTQGFIAQLRWVAAWAPANRTLMVHGPVVI